MLVPASQGHEGSALFRVQGKWQTKEIPATMPKDTTARRLERQRRVEVCSDGKCTLQGNGDSGSAALTRMLWSHLDAACTHLSHSGLASTQWSPNMGPAFWSAVTWPYQSLKQERNPKGGSDMIKGHIFMA